LAVRRFRAGWLGDAFMAADLGLCRSALAGGSRVIMEARGNRMGKSSTARQERLQRSRESGAPLEAIRNPAREAPPADLDRLIHERIRLGIVSALAVNRSLTFNELKALLKPPTET